MQKIFWDNAYQTHLMTTVSSVNNNRILLTETIAFSFSGGQESDRAYINGMNIIDSVIDGHLIYYNLPEGHGLSVGEKVLMEIDWPRRYRLMRLHFAAELILELIMRELNIQKIGAHIAETKARIDFIYDKNIAWVFNQILTQYNDIIRQDKLIKTGFSNSEKQKRYWEIDGFAKVPCGGTHVKSTAEVGYIDLKRVNIGGGKERIEIRLVNN
jgi:Ser-tRNA(Ala) deacylase AlaX